LQYNNNNKITPFCLRFYLIQAAAKAVALLSTVGNVVLEKNVQGIWWAVVWSPRLEKRVGHSSNKNFNRYKLFASVYRMISPSERKIDNRWQRHNALMA